MYASPQAISRQELWQALPRLSTGLNAPWMVIGDFNSMLLNDEKMGGGRSTLATV